VNRLSTSKAGLQHPALPRAVDASVVESSSQDSADDRILLTLLALGLMLLAFFVVLTSTGTFDQRRIRGVVQSVQMTFERGQSSEGESLTPAAIDAANRAAVVALRAAVADIFADMIVEDQNVLTDNRDRINPDRVEVDVPLALFFSDDGALNALPLLDKIVAVISSPPAGYRMELFARARISADEMLSGQSRIAALADGLVTRGAAPTSLSVGVQGDGDPTAASSLRFTFLLLDANDDLAALRLLAAAESAR